MTYVVYAEEYYFSLKTFSTVLKKNVYNVSYNQEAAEEVKAMLEEAFQKRVDAGEVNANNEILTTYTIEVKCLDEKLSLTEASKRVIDDDYTWGKVGSSK